MTQDTGISAEQARRAAELVQLEGMLLDERDWDRWLALYEPDAEYWVPAWDDDGKPTTDPQRELSLIFYESRSGLEDRVFRIREGRSSATMPLFRTCHIRTPPLCRRKADLVEARFNWITHAFRNGKSLSYFGQRTLWLRERPEGLRIAKSYTLVSNDLIDQVLDVYHL